MTIEESVRIKADIGRVWETFIDLTCWAEWNTVLRDVPDGHDRLREGESFRCSLSPFAFSIEIRPLIVEVLKHRKIVWKSRRFGISARHEFLFRKIGGGVKVISREELKGIPLAVSGMLFPKWKIQELTRTFLEDLRNASEVSR